MPTIESFNDLQDVSLHDDNEEICETHMPLPPHDALIIRDAIIEDARLLNTKWAVFIQILKHSPLAVAPFCNAIYDGSVMVQGGTDFAIANNLRTETRIVYISVIGSFAFLQSLLLNFRTTIAEFKDTLLMFPCFGGQISSHWPHLSPRVFKLTFGITMILGVFAAISDYFGGNYFVGDMQDEYKDSEIQLSDSFWEGLAKFTGSVAAITTLFTEGIGIFKVIGSLMDGTLPPYKNNYSGAICLTVGNLIIFLTALEVAVEAHASMQNLTNPQGNAEVIGTLLSATPKIVSDMCFSGILTLEIMDDFIGYLTTYSRRKHLNPLQVTSFILALGVSALVESPQLSLTWSLMTDDTTKLPFYVPELSIYGLGLSTTIRDGILQTYFFHYVFLYLLTMGAVLGKKAFDAVSALVNRCYGNEETPRQRSSVIIQLEDDDTELSSYRFYDDKSWQPTLYSANSLNYSNSAPQLNGHAPKTFRK